MACDSPGLHNIFLFFHEKNDKQNAYTLAKPYIIRYNMTVSRRMFAFLVRNSVQAYLVLRGTLFLYCHFLIDPHHPFCISEPSKRNYRVLFCIFAEIINYRPLSTVYSVHFRVHNLVSVQYYFLRPAGGVISLHGPAQGIDANTTASTAARLAKPVHIKRFIQIHLLSFLLIIA